MRSLSVHSVCALLFMCVMLPFNGKGNDDLRTFQRLLLRLVPKQAEAFTAQIATDRKGDFFRLSYHNNQILLQGNNANSLAVGLNYYLKYYCLTSVSWYADDPVEMPSRLPPISTPVDINAKTHNRFFFNYCTFGYSMPWWQWRDWERMIDWMALNGINMPLAITGQEAIWYRVWKKFGLTDLQIRNYFTGPAHLPWHRMSNLDSWQGPLPKSYIDHQFSVQKKILQRERELNMTPILPAFAGHVPGVLQQKYPASKISRLSEWGGFTDANYRTYFLDPFDPLFKKIQREFLQDQQRAFGSGHLYGADPFNEVKPPSWEPQYLAEVASTIYSSMSASDPQARWLMMTWVFSFERVHWTSNRVKAFVTAVPQDKLILLDYFGEQTEVWTLTDTFYRQPYLWCYLGNFGGNTMLAGNLEETAVRLHRIFTKGGNNFSGVGATPEGLDVNPFMYEYVFEQAWDMPVIDVRAWMRGWADRRVGKKDNDVENGWLLLLDSVYTRPARLGHATLINARPTLTGSGNWTTDPTTNYTHHVLFKVLGEILKSNSKRRSFQFDVVNVGRQFLGNFFLVLRDRFNYAYQIRDVIALETIGQQMMELLNDMDELLSTQHSFSLSTWLTRARHFASNATEKKYYEKNARMILTTWGKSDQSLNDYASRNWSGLTSTYYAKRWKMFVEDVIASAKAAKKFNEDHFRKKMIEFERNWSDGHFVIKQPASQDALTIAKKIFDKYQTVL